MDDTNLVLHLKDGQEVKVIYPHRVFYECETPWLERAGCLQTSNPSECLAKFKNDSIFGVNGRFVIGLWMPSYLENEKRIQTIPMNKVDCIVPANQEDTTRGNHVRWEENQNSQDAFYGDGTITRKILAELFPEKAQQILTRPREEYKS